MKLTEYPSYLVNTIGNDGTLIATLDNYDWEHFVNGKLSPENREWYSTPGMKILHNYTGLGYFPRGITLAEPDQPALIVLNSTYAADERLAAHEYGHALGKGHTMLPTTMNPTSSMRWYDSENLIPAFRSNFPSYQVDSQNPLLSIAPFLLTGVLLALFLKR